MANINRVVLVGNLTKDPELRHTPSGTAVCKLRLAVNTRQKDGADRRVGRQAELLRRHRLGQPGRELRAVPREGPPGRRRRPARLARVGCPGRHQAPGRRDHRRQRPVPRAAGPRRGRRAAAVRPERRHDRERRLRQLRQRRRHPVLMAQRDQRQQRKGRPPPAGRSGSGTATSAARRSTEVDYKNVEPAPPLRLREGQDPLPADHRRLSAAPAAGRAGREAGARDGAPPLLHRLGHAGHPPTGRREDRVARRGRGRRSRLRAQLPPAAQAGRDGDACEGRRAAQARGEAGSARGAELRAGAGDRAEGSRPPSCASTSPPARRARSSARSRRPTSPSSCGSRRRCGSIGASSSCRSRSSGSGATRSRSSSLPT